MVKFMYQMQGFPKQCSKSYHPPTHTVEVLAESVIDMGSLTVKSGKSMSKASPRVMSLNSQSEISTISHENSMFFSSIISACIIRMIETISMIPPVTRVTIPPRTLEYLSFLLQQNFDEYLPAENNFKTSKIWPNKVCCLVLITTWVFSSASQAT
ncbi:hypothetical protein FGO68_gene5148 [Halteria grandinella]|uniref:Uncharacterized protein n=1 Tax=Halteria grandinella TaxID=5974 RepID=A0A8J8T428_HALGN|nr:hypothetical protein FGO68_gene5148 [Halteria grandinella]